MKHRFPLPWLHLHAVVSLLVFLAHQGLAPQGALLPRWATNHLNDLLCIPLVGVLSLHGTWALKGDRTWRANGYHVLALVIIFSLYFELYLPRVQPRYTGDLWDVACYVLGGLVFLGLQRLEWWPASGPGLGKHFGCRGRASRASL